MLHIRNNVRRLIHLLICFFLSIVVIVFLNNFSNRVNHRPNGFIRLFPPHPISAKYVFDLRFNSFYLAGATESRIYLGNKTTPSYLYSFSHQLSDSHQLKLIVPPKLRFTLGSTLNIVDSPFVYQSEYKNSLILYGEFPQLKLQIIDDSTAYFEYKPFSPNIMILQMENPLKNQNLLIKKNYTPPYFADTSYVLDAQRNGIIYTDGILLYNKFSGRLFYVYYYKNQFISLDTNLKPIYAARTIDTISSPHIKLSKISDNSQITMGAPPLMVNKRSAVNENWLLINSGLLAENEIKEAFDSSAVIDVYEQDRGKYNFSFYIPNHQHEKLKNFYLYHNELIVLYDHTLFIYLLKF